MTTNPTAEVTGWAPPAKVAPSQKRPSTIMLESMLEGATLRITHTDLACHWPLPNCSLLSGISRLRLYEHWHIEAYHEEQHVAVVRRLPKKEGQTDG